MRRNWDCNSTVISTKTETQFVIRYLDNQFSGSDEKILIRIVDERLQKTELNSGTWRPLWPSLGVQQGRERLWAHPRPAHLTWAHNTVIENKSQAGSRKDCFLMVHGNNLNKKIIKISAVGQTLHICLKTISRRIFFFYFYWKIMFKVKCAYCKSCDTV